MSTADTIKTWLAVLGAPIGAAIGASSILVGELGKRRSEAREDAREDLKVTIQAEQAKTDGNRFLLELVDRMSSEVQRLTAAQHDTDAHIVRIEEEHERYKQTAAARILELERDQKETRRQLTDALAENAALRQEVEELRGKVQQTGVDLAGLKANGGAHG
jgi:hypothetical protein